MTARLVTLLALAACLQLAAVAFLYWPGNGQEDDAAGSAVPLLSLAREDVAHISVADASGRETGVYRQDEQWRIDGTALPAAAAAVERLLDALSRPTGFPVARSDSARERFEVADARFQRRITLASGDAQASNAAESPDSVVIYLGTSPGLRQVYARRSDSAAILAITLSTFDVPATRDGWLESSLLALPSIDRVRYGDSEWTKSDDRWSTTASRSASTAPTPQASLKALEQALRTLQATGVAASEREDGRADTVAYEVFVRHGDQDITLRLATPPTGGEPRLYRSDYDHGFTLSRYDHDRLAEALKTLGAQPTGESYEPD